MTKLKQILSQSFFLYFFILLFSMVLGRFSLEAFTIAGSLVGIYLLARYWSFYFPALRDNRYIYVSLGFLLPIAIATIDSLDQSMSLSVLLRMVRYVLIGTLAVSMARYPDNFRRLESFTFWAIMLISLDAVIQWQTNYHIYGHDPVYGNRVFGIFRGKAHLSYFLGTFTPIILFYLYRMIIEKRSIFRILGAIIALTLLITAIIIGGARAGMISLAVSIFLFVLYLFISAQIKHKGKLLGGLIVVLALAIGLASQSKIVQHRFQTTTSAFGSEQFWDRFTSLRTNIWKVGFNEVPNYWINGVGPRAFDKIYQTYPAEYKVFSYVWQPHLQGLEVLIETGFIGFIPYLLILLYLLIRIFRAPAGNNWLMMGFVAMMPINSHVGLYEGFWMPLIWIPIMLGLALGYRREG